MTMQPIAITEPENPTSIGIGSYILSVTSVAVVAIIAVTVLLVIRPEKDNSTLVTLIFGFASNVAVVTALYIKASDTHSMLNSRMNEFKRSLESASAAAQAKAYQDGQNQGRNVANDRTDALASALEKQR